MDRPVNGVMLGSSTTAALVMAGQETRLFGTSLECAS